MADPRSYAVSYDFSNQPIPLANEFANVATSVSDLVLSTKQIRRSDGHLRNKIVTLESLSIEVLQAIVSGTIPTVPGSADAITIAFNPAGNIAATDVQNAIEELDTEKAPLVHTHGANFISLDAVTNLVATNVQAAIAELRTYGAVTGDLALTLNSTAPPGWLMLDDNTIGDLSSGAVHKSPLFEVLFAVIWNSVGDSFAPVSTGRGASPAADWAAHKSITLPKVLGRALAVAGQGAGLSSYAVGQANIGAETFVLAQSQLPNIIPVFSGATLAGHAHTYNAYPAGTVANSAAAGGAFIIGSATAATATDSVSAGTPAGTISSINGNVAQTAIENRQPTAFWLARIKI